MAYIQPNSRIEFFSDIGLSQDYNDTLYFPSMQAKDDYFTNSVYGLAHVDKCYYARENRGFVRVELPMTTMIHAQYMRFKNTSYENKWWYAFVTDVIYVNDNTTEVRFELDVMMTWMGEFTLSPCFVERQHSVTDNIGDNIVDETFNTGEYVNNSATRTDLFGYNQGYFIGNTAWSYMVFYTEPTIIENPIETALGIFNGLSVNIYPNTEEGLRKMQAFLKTDNIITSVQGIVVVPEELIPRIPNYIVPYEGAKDYSTVQRDLAPYVRLVSVSKTFIEAGDSLPTVDGYTPRNNKLFTYPYNVLVVWNSEDKENIYRYELFDDQDQSNVWFNIVPNISLKTEVGCYPRGYRDLGVNYNEGITMREFSMGSWASDMFLAYLAQTLSAAPVRMLTSATIDGAISQTNAANMNQFSVRDQSRTLNSEVNFANGNQSILVDERKDITRTPAGNMRPVVTSAYTTGQILKEGTEHLLQPNLAHGQALTDVMTVLSMKDFWFFRRTVRRDYAKMIDDYWTMYGYPDKTVHSPNMNARQRFTYVKTQACKINCRCPASDANTIEELFNKGIRFWKSHTDIGNYTDANLPIGG